MYNVSVVLSKTKSKHASESTVRWTKSRLNYSKVQSSKSSRSHAWQPN